MITVVGVSGKIGAGKDVIAGYLRERHGFRVVRMADALKHEVLATVPRTLRALWDLNYSGVPEPSMRDLERLVYDLKPRGVRELLQEWGTELRRAENPHYWIEKWWAGIQPGDKVVVPDVRFTNEAEAITLRRGCPLRLVSELSVGYLIKVTRLGTESVLLHSSEAFVGQFDGWDYVFRNDGTVKDLHHAVESWYSVTIQ